MSAWYSRPENQAKQERLVVQVFNYVAQILVEIRLTCVAWRFNGLKQGAKPRGAWVLRGFAARFKALKLITAKLRRLKLDVLCNLNFT